MGHTLVAAFEPRFNAFLHGVLDPMEANKVPYGRQCDRELANGVLDYHMTIVHWSGQEDGLYLPRVRALSFSGFHMTVRESRISEAQENSWILYYPLCPGENYTGAIGSICAAMQVGRTSIPHITLAISKDPESLQQMKNALDSRCRYPFVIHADALELYHIWQPVRKVCRIPFRQAPDR